MKKKNIFLGIILSVIFSGCMQQNLQIVNLTNDNNVVYKGYYDYKTKQLKITDGIKKSISSPTVRDITQVVKEPSTTMIVDQHKHQNCGLIMRKSRLFSTSSLVQKKEDVRTSGIIKLNDTDFLSITIDEVYNIGEAKDQNSSCYKVLLSKPR